MKVKISIRKEIVELNKVRVDVYVNELCNITSIANDLAKEMKNLSCDEIKCKLYNMHNNINEKYLEDYLTYTVNVVSKKEVRDFHFKFIEKLTSTLKALKKENDKRALDKWLKEKMDIELEL
jgi:hypothetical protein